MIQRAEPEAAPVGSNRFRPGDLVRHRRYGYRGVVVGFDLRCMADEAWYQANQTQPRKDQPWYHVLVHGTGSATYAAEENLLPDDSIDPIEHPMLDVFFSAYRGGRYVRNEVPWAGW
jgi:heat shock protein HspQ